MFRGKFQTSIDITSKRICESNTGLTEDDNTISSRVVSRTKHSSETGDVQNNRGLSLLSEVRSGSALFTVFYRRGHVLIHNDTQSETQCYF